MSHGLFSGNDGLNIARLCAGCKVDSWGREFDKSITDVSLSLVLAKQSEVYWFNGPWLERVSCYAVCSFRRRLGRSDKRHYVFAMRSAVRWISRDPPSASARGRSE